MGRNVLGVFAKNPAAGQVKTRLAAETDPGFAAGLADAMVRDIVKKCATLADRRFLVYAPAGAREYFASLAADDYTLENQAEGELGQRLAQFMKRHLEGGNRVVVLGSDSPTVPAEYVVRAFDELERADVVLGPATDGGYYLIGCRARCPPLFENMPWGGREVLQETVTRIRASGLRLGLLPPWYDIDTLADVQMLRGHLAALRLAGVDPGAGRTEAASENYESRTSKSASDFTKSEVRT